MLPASVVVSVVVPMYNAERYISETLSSILKEHDVSLEVIVVNDRSTDRSAEIVQSVGDSRIRLLDGEGRGAAAAMNVGYAAACGSIIMICDADDFYPEGRIKRQVIWMNQHPEFDAVCGGFYTIDEKGTLLANMNCGDSEAEITGELVDGHLRTSYCTYAIRTDLARRVGAFREFFSSAYDLDFQLRLGAAGRVYFLPDQFYCYRIHSSSITHTQSTKALEFFTATAYRLHEQRRVGQLDDLQLGIQIPLPTVDQTKSYSASVHAQELLLGQAWRDHAAGRRWRAVRAGIRAVAANPLRATLWKSLLALSIKTPRKGRTHH